MTVKELGEILLHLPPDADVYVEKDGEASEINIAPITSVEADDETSLGYLIFADKGDFIDENTEPKQMMLPFDEKDNEDREKNKS